MKIAMMGSGGVGGYFGGRLAAKGYDVTFIARGAHLGAMRERGLEIESGVAPMLLAPVRVTDDPATIGPVDVVLLSVKLWDTEAAAQSLKPLIGPNSAVISLQNGVDAEPMLAGILGTRHVMGGVAQIGAKIARPGVIEHVGTMQRLMFGELDGERSHRAEALLSACIASGITAEISIDIVKTIWTKFVFLTGMSSVTSLTRLPIGPIRKNPEARALLLNVMREVVQVARKKGIGLDADFADQQIKFVEGLPETMTTSMHHDLERGNRLELPWLAGTVARFGRELGIDTPYSNAILGGLALYANGKPA
ncbi:MAG: 2-dehydropantoate 2-reductase [Pseudomonadota bacterium]